MIKSLLILGLILISFPSATSSQFTKITQEDNQKRLEHCGLPKFESKVGQNMARVRDSPWHVLFSKNNEASRISGVFISPQHIITDPAILYYFNKANSWDKLVCGPDKGIHVMNTTGMGLTGHKDINVDIGICSKTDCEHMIPLKDIKIVEVHGLGPCNWNYSLILIEINAPQDVTPACLPSGGMFKDEEVVVEAFDGDTYTAENAHIVKEKNRFIWTNISLENPERRLGVPIIAEQNGKYTVIAMGKLHYWNKGNGPYQLLSENFVNLICDLTGVCNTKSGDETKPEPAQHPKPTPEATQAPPTPEASQATQMNQQSSGPTEKSRIIVDWPPPLPTVRPGIREPTVDHLPQIDEEYEYENQLLMEYEQIEKGEQEKEKEEKKGTERWNVLVAVGVTVLIGLIL